MKKWIKYGVFLEGITVLFLILFGIMGDSGRSLQTTAANGTPEATSTPDHIKWVDFDVTYEALCKAYQLDVDTYGKKVHLNWVELLAYTAAKSGGAFSSESLTTLSRLEEALSSGESTMEELGENIKTYPYYYEVYEAVLGEYIGEFEVQESDETGKTSYMKKYGLKVFSPVARGFEYSDYDDFGTSRGYGYQRQHLGHDMMGQIGTPIIAVEGGTVEALGWNQYGGWRIGIRSSDQKRYYYYAHLRQNRPYSEGLKEGDLVQSGDVIGYMGHTGYSAQENVNNIDSVHLHFGVQLIFDESQKDGNGEIWIDCYNLIRFLSKNRCGVVKDEATKEWSRESLRKDCTCE